MNRLVLAAALAAALSAPAIAATPGGPKVDPAQHERALVILKTGISHRTVAGAGVTPAYAEFLKGVLVKAGYNPADITVEPMFGTAILIARYPGTDPKKKPIVISGHMDVVEARREDWTRDPFTPVVENGYVFGRGSVDNKFDISMVVATLARLRETGWKPGRDVILALSGDEETAMRTTAVLAQRLSNAEMVLNVDVGGGQLAEDGSPVSYGVQGAEKTYADFTLTATDAGGHSSRPTPGNPITRLARALEKLDAYAFPVMSNEVTRASMAAAASNTPGELGLALKAFAANPEDKAAAAVLTADHRWLTALRTTCVVTMINGGHAPNALPQKVTANVNCRIFPGTPSSRIREELVKVLDDPAITVTRNDDGSIDSPPSPLRADVMAAVTKAVHARYPGLPVVPSQSSGASDSMYFRAAGVPSYGVAGLFIKDSDDFKHGLNERAPIAAIDGALAHWNSILRDLAK